MTATFAVSTSLYKARRMLAREEASMRDAYAAAREYLGYARDCLARGDARNFARRLDWARHERTIGRVWRSKAQRSRAIVRELEAAL